MPEPDPYPRPADFPCCCSQPDCCAATVACCIRQSAIQYWRFQCRSWPEAVGYGWHRWLNSSGCNGSYKAGCSGTGSVRWPHCFEPYTCSMPPARRATDVLTCKRRYPRPHFPVPVRLRPDARWWTLRCWQRSGSCPSPSSRYKRKSTCSIHLLPAVWSYPWMTSLWLTLSRCSMKRTDWTSRSWRRYTDWICLHIMYMPRLSRNWVLYG